MDNPTEVTRTPLLLTILTKMVSLVDRLGQTQWFFDQMAAFMNDPRQKRKAFAGHTPSASDVIVATYAKSGTNWAMQIALQTAFYGDAEFAFVHDLIPWPDVPLLILKAKLHDQSLAKRSPTGLRVIKTHWEQDYVPYRPEAKYIVVIRDPKEVFVSGYHFARAMSGSVMLPFRYTPADWLELFLSDRFTFGPWAEHTASWWAYRSRPNVLVTIYHEMKRSPGASVEQIAALMGVSLTGEQLAKVIHKSSFEYMQSNEDRFVPPMFSAGRKVMFRSGKSRFSGELIDAAQQDAIDRFTLSELQRLGSDFPYAELFI